MMTQRGALGWDAIILKDGGIGLLHDQELPSQKGVTG